MTFRIRITSRNRAGRRVERATYTHAYLHEAEKDVIDCLSVKWPGTHLRVRLQTMDMHGHVISQKDYSPEGHREKK